MAAVRGLAVDRAAAQVVAALRDARIRSILLKGASFEDWLYERGEPRSYGDIDLLVSRGDVQPAGRILTTLGYHRRMATGRDFDGLFEDDRDQVTHGAPIHADHARVWVRPRDGMNVDLHRTLIGVEGEVDPWDELAAQTDSMRVANTEVEILSEPGRALHVALHAVHRGESEKPLIDLARALERLPTTTWKAAALLAERLGAQRAFATGLRMQPAGAELAAALGLTTERSVETVMFANSVPYSAWTVNRVAKTRGFGPRLSIIAHRIFPEPEFMRVWYPIARRGAVGLGLAYARRWVWLAGATGPAIRAWWSARRET